MSSSASKWLIQRFGYRTVSCRLNFVKARLNGTENCPQKFGNLANVGLENARMGNEPLPSRGGAGPHAYDPLYAADADQEARHERQYHRLFRRVADIAIAKSLPSVLEVGCGSGVLARILIDGGVSYTGFDFNRTAVEKAKKRNGSDRHFVGDATDPASYTALHDGIVCCEVLEHIDADLEAIKLWKPGALCICSVPNFDDPTHVRLFRHEDEVKERYGQLIDIEWIERIPVSPIAGSTLREYLRRLRWSRDNPRKFLGLLGINRFEWLNGWFLFVGTRRAPAFRP